MKNFEKTAFNGYTLLQSVESHWLFALNDTARFIVRRHAEGVSAEEIAGDLSGNYDIAPSDALRDVRDCLAAWQEKRPRSMYAAVPPVEMHTFEAGAAAGQSPGSATGRECRWPIRLAGRSMEIVCSDSSLEEGISSLTSHLRSEEASAVEAGVEVHRTDDGFSVSSGRGQSRGARDVDELLQWLQFAIVELAYQGRDLMGVLHAGAVGIDGGAVILAGECGAGKTTLIAALQRQGFTYLSDDVCPLERDEGKLIPVPACQALKEGSWPVLVRMYPGLAGIPARRRFGRDVRYFAPQSGDSREWDRQWPVRALVFPLYRQGAATRVHPLYGIDAFQGLIDAGAFADDRVWDLTEWLERTPAYGLEYSDMAGAAAALSSLGRGV